jgi:5,10-methylenetetrahydromethanopterin reductase
MDGAPNGGIELWMGTSNTEGLAVAIAQEAEANGFDGITLGDVECQNPDAFVGLTVAGVATSHLQLGVGVTNPVTRHPAVLACSIASVQHESGGRAVLGIGRGDSAVRKIGLKAATVDELEHYLIRLQRYLSGEKVDEDGPLAQLTWIKEMSVPKVPVDVAGSGPQTIRAGARQAERVTLNVGADPDRVRSGVELAREARGAAGLELTGVSMGAYIAVGPHPDRELARGLIKPVGAVYARFSRAAGQEVGPLADKDQSVIRNVIDHYDMNRHGRGGASHLAYLTEDFIDRFGVAGPVDYCIDRLAGLFELGLDRISLVGPTRDAPPEVVEESRRLLFTEVMPGVRAAVAATRGS